ncbi:TPA: DNA recombination/repair protein RecA, partial [Candidatus Poribacteria bacterium]|nr:DNA recombination/repair protein RecA [Candidatus Poribacteria bacterium]HEX30145.1 DNA recombination/repair protein RecA [Candidatus Poribacteria bacterium]
DLIGKKIRVKVTKNKVAPPFTEAEFEMIFGEDISKEGDILDTGVEMGIIQRSGAWYSYGEHKLGQGRDKAKEFFRENPQIAAEIEGKIREVINAQKGTGEMPEKTTAEEEEETVEEAAN